MIYKDKTTESNPEELFIVMRPFLLDPKVELRL
jgi:hypothetical protein